jgi:hypothetical protein
MRTILSLVVFFVSAASLAAAREAFTYPKMVRYLFRADRLFQPLLPGERCIQFSSYDRKSDKGPSDHEAWYANGDRGQFLRAFERDGRVEHVMVDAKGPGIVTRIWSANPSGNLYFYFDGEKQPRYVIPFQELTGGKTKPFVEPWSGVRARGWNCHVPFPFAKSLIVTADTRGFYYQVQIRQYGPQMPMESFRPEMLEELPDVGELFRTRPWDSRPGATSARPGPVGAFAAKHEFQLTARNTCTALFQPDASTGSVLLRDLQIQLLGGRPGELDPLLRGLRLRIRTATEVLVDVPFGEFFCYLPGSRDVRTRFLEAKRILMRPRIGKKMQPKLLGHFFRCRFPMPLPVGSSVELLQDPSMLDKQDGRFQVRSSFRYDRLALRPGTLFFRANWHGQNKIKTRPFSAHNVLNATGTGRVAGVTLYIGNPERPWWGEGDEKIWVDGESFPSTFGTGTEDYFGYAWCSNQLFEHPLHAQPYCDGPGNYGHTLVHRTQLMTDVPFNKQLRFDFEVWYGSSKPVELDYATTVYWYGAQGASSGLPPMPPAHERTYRHFEPILPWIVKDAIEGETLKATKKPSGTLQTQAMENYIGVQWSRDKQLWWYHGKPGAELELAVPVAKKGRYELRIRYTCADDYAVVQTKLNGKRISRPIDLYRTRVMPTKELSLGEHELDAGQFLLQFEILGKNAKARPGYMFGLDYVRLVPVR